jgi:rod shape-determining protein MreD
VATILALPVLVVLIMFQTVVVSRLPLLLGTADLILLALTAWALQERVKNAWVWTILGGVLVSVISAVPFYTPLIGYAAVTAIARVLQRRVWQTPVLAMFIATFLGTLITQGLSIIALKINGVPIDLQESLRLVILPSLLLNLVLAFPIRAIMVDLAAWVYPVEIQL